MRGNRIILAIILACFAPGGAAFATQPPQMFGPQFVLQPQSTLGPVSGGQDRFEIAAGDGRFTEVWHDSRQFEYVYELCRLMQHFVSFYGQTIDDGTLPNPPGTKMCDLGGTLSIAWNGQNYLATMQIGNEIHACRISPTGAMLDAYNGLFVSAGADASVASDGTDWFVVYTVMTGSGSRIYGVKISASGQVGYSGRLCSAESTQTVPNVSWTGGVYLVAFQDQRSDAGDIYAVRVQPDGTVLDSVGFAVCAASGSRATAGMACSCKVRRRLFAISVRPARKRSCLASGSSQAASRSFCSATSRASSFSRAFGVREARRSSLTAICIVLR